MAVTKTKKNMTETNIENGRKNNLFQIIIHKSCHKQCSQLEKQSTTCGMYSNKTKQNGAIETVLTKLYSQEMVTKKQTKI